MSGADPIKVIEKYWRRTPVPIEEIIRELGLKLSYEEMPDSTSGYIQRDDNGYEIVVNAIHPTTRRRFTAAHELAHFIYHRDLLGKGVGDNRAYRSENTRLPNPAITPSHERQANSFAANLLMPKHALEDIPRSADIVALAKKFEVSPAAMRIRLGR